MAAYRIFQLLILFFAFPATQPTQVSDSAAFAMSLQSAMRPDAARAQAAATHESNATAQVHGSAVWSGDRNQ
jgi:hypothetical protein